MVDFEGADPAPGAAVRGWAGAFTRFSRHVQDSAADPAEAAWLLEVLGVLFGGRDEVRRRRPFSFLFCPLSPLALEGPYTDAWLATVDWGLPVAAMPMPMMGLSAPVGLLATTVLGTAETLATLCLVQAAAPGTPFIFAPALAVMEPRSGRWAGGAVEHALLGAATTEMARFYGLPVEASVGGTDAHLPGAQAAAERAVNWLLPAPGLAGPPGGSGPPRRVDRPLARAAGPGRRGVPPLSPPPARDRRARSRRPSRTALDEVGPGGDFLSRPATRRATHHGEWYLDRLGVHDTWEHWAAAGRPDVVDDARRLVTETLAAHRPLPMDEATARELAGLVDRATEARARCGEGGLRDALHGELPGRDGP